MSKMNKSNCIGCRNNMYNGGNNLGVSECWSLATAKIKTRYSIPSYLPTYKENFTKVRVPDCFHRDGTAHVDSIAQFPKRPKE